jgi:hypothetical protein
MLVHAASIALERVRQLAAFGFGEPGRPTGLDASRAMGPMKQGSASFSQMQSIPAAGNGVPAAFDEAAVFELIDEGNKAAGNHAEHAGQRLLRDSRRCREDLEDPRVRRGEIQVLERSANPAAA